ncbi:aromatic ring-hydroxylating dioxygenase subunit alpha [Neptuniibacter sp. CAU 1671]|uniref:aromatic ring-hydroxylating dioxygenase subunit alpha n=1 Tax=Neptuniibacter sp. CAU 1671 TaxID=3032593 RepID=UPI0023D9A3FD|nr:aromatic ring-hydroxylating dioxygenase subunit alpha [Neptuniibacter sp. CAU 1671]MDF2180557.1 aromatic ring-hydroxylating dioxygenase subunit alpha [Neptuniibacter sp. CAU 1671]
MIITSDKTTSPFLRNAWYIAALSKEVDDEALFTRKLLNESVLMYRNEAKQVIAMRDRCPHRFAPLSMGKRLGDVIQCHYHGLHFDAQGECVHNPHGNGKIPKACAVQTYPIIERDGFIWIWMGDQEKADAAMVRNLSIYTENPESAVGHDYMYNKCRYDLVVDNVMDLSHVDHLHGPLLNSAGKLSPQVPQVKELDNNRISIRWDWTQEPAMLLFREHMPRTEDAAQMFVEVVWQAPASMTLEVGAVQDSSDFTNDGAVLYDFHAVTPETEHTTHYFFASSRNYKMDDCEYNRMKMEGMIEAFTQEDKPVLEAQYREMGDQDFWELNPVLLSSDVGSLRVRRTLDKLIAEEQQA